MLIRLLMTGLLLLSGLRGLQACIGEAGHFHFEIAHSHDDHCDGHAHSAELPTSPQCEHSDNHWHVDLSSDEPINQGTHRLTIRKGQPRILATLPPIFSESLSGVQALHSPSEISRRAKSLRKLALSTIVLRL